MTNTSVRVFLPEEALQGEEIPSFALWREVAFDGIRVQIPHGLKVSEVYNVAKDDWSFSGRELSVKRVEVNGYLGLVLSSEQLIETSKEVEISWEFIGKDGTLSESRQIHVFRPMIEAEVPNEIRIEKSAKTVGNPLRITNKGLGTVIISFRASEDSEAQLKEPEVIRDFEKSFTEDALAGFSEMKTQFPTRHNLIDKITNVFTKPQDLSNKENLDALRQTAEEVNKVNSEDQTFLESIGEVLGTALLANLQKFNIFQQLAEYIHSVEGKKILVMNPLSTVHIKSGKSSLHLRVEYRDLAYGYYAPLDIQTLILSSEETTFPVYKLFSWGNGAK